LAKDEKRAGELFKQACDGGDMDGCFDLGNCYAKGWCGVGRDAMRAGELYKKACDDGLAPACEK
jgi:hypothetical protein